MKLSIEQLRQFEQQGYVICKDLFTSEEMKTLRGALQEILNDDIDRPGVSREKNSKAPRLIYGADQFNEVFARLVRHPRWMEPAKQILESDVYIHQLRINPKAPYEGEGFWWHQDFSTWHFEDGMPTSNALMIAVFMDDIYDTNGPLMVIPGSHKYGEIPERVPNPDETGYTVMEVSRDVVAGLVKESGIEALTGSAGSVMFMHCNLLHASAGNVTPYPRSIIYINANSVGNIPTKKKRAAHHCNPDATALEPLEDDCLVS